MQNYDIISGVLLTLPFVIPLCFVIYIIAFEHGKKEQKAEVELLEEQKKECHQLLIQCALQIPLGRSVSPRTAEEMREILFPAEKEDEDKKT